MKLYIMASSKYIDSYFYTYKTMLVAVTSVFYPRSSIQKDISTKLTFSGMNKNCSYSKIS